MSVIYLHAVLTLLRLDFNFYSTDLCVIISLASCSCALETLSTLKFAQRAKFIRNNVYQFVIFNVFEFISIFSPLELYPLDMLLRNFFVGNHKWRCFWGCPHHAYTDSAAEGITLFWHQLSFLLWNYRFMKLPKQCNCSNFCLNKNCKLSFCLLPAFCEVFNPFMTDNVTAMMKCLTMHSSDD